MAKRIDKAKRINRNNKKKKKRRSPLQLLREGWFYRIYFGLLALCAIALVFGLVTLHGVLREYEQTRPVHCAEEVLALFNARDWAQIHDLDESARQLKYESVDQYAQYMEECTAGGEAFALKSVLTIDESEQKYSVLLDDKKVAELTLRHSGETTKHNFDQWEVASLALTAYATSEYTVTVPSDFTVQVNGRTLTQEDVIESGIPTAAEGNLPEGVAPPVMTKYGVYMAMGEPQEVLATDKNGAARELTRDDERSWSCGLAYDDSLKEKFEGPVVQWGRRIAAYTTGDYSKSDLSGACINPSPARTYIRNMENQWAAAHSGYDFENIQTYDYYIYSDNCFSCRISFDYIVHYRQEDKTYPTKYTLYFARSGNGFKLYSFTVD